MPDTPEPPFTFGPPVGNGLRDATGSLIGGLDCLEYTRGYEDFEAGTPPPRLTTASYDLGRQLAARRAEERADMHAALEREREAADARFRAVLADMGPRGAEALRDYDAMMRDVESGVHGARNCWHSLSPAQRRVVLFLAPGRVLVRSARVPGYYDAVPTLTGAADTIARAARLDTARKLARHGLVAWQADGRDPEARATLTWTSAGSPAVQGREG